MGGTGAIDYVNMYGDDAFEWNIYEWLLQYSGEEVKNDLEVQVGK
jgi:hypothetical protein